MTLAVAEMYVQGVSTRKVEPILEQLVGHGVRQTTTRDSRIVASSRAFRTAAPEPNTKANSHGTIFDVTASMTVMFVLADKGCLR